MDYKLLNFQFVFFIDSLNLRSNEKSNFLNKFSNLFDGEQTILPIPEDVPDDIPRMLISSKDNKNKVSFTKNRVELTCQNEEIKILDFGNITQEVFGILENNRVGINSIGFVIRIILEQKNVNARIEKLLKEDIKDRFGLKEENSSLIVRNSQKITLNIAEKEIICNKLFTISSDVTDSRNGNRVCFVELDVNTKSDNSKKIDSKSVLKAFFEKVQEKHKELLKFIESVFNENGETEQ